MAIETYFFKEIMKPPPSITTEVLSFLNLNYIPTMYMYKRDNINQYGLERTARIGVKD